MGRPKAQLVFEGETFIARLVRVLGAQFKPVIAVTAQPIAIEGAQNVVNPDPSRGMLSSLQCGIRALPAAAEAFVFTPVDIPSVAEQTIEELATGWSGEPLRIPRFEGRRGHPVLAARSVASELVQLPVEAKASDVIHRYASQTTYVDVDDPGILRDVDTPADYEALVGGGRR